MKKHDKILLDILFYKKDKGIKFDDLCFLLESLGFNKRIKGDHHIYYIDGVTEIINIQPNKNMAKPYQVKQVRNIILKYSIGGITNE